MYDMGVTAPFLRPMKCSKGTVADLHICSILLIKIHLGRIINVGWSGALRVQQLSKDDHI